MRQSIELAFKDGLNGAEAIEQLVSQVCYRAADLGLLLAREGHRLEQYSRHLRREKDTVYDEDYFEEPPPPLPRAELCLDRFPIP